jgi:hypothetical protein
MAARAPEYARAHGLLARTLMKELRASEGRRSRPRRGGARSGRAH